MSHAPILVMALLGATEHAFDPAPGNIGMNWTAWIEAETARYLATDPYAQAWQDVLQKIQDYRKTHPERTDLDEAEKRARRKLEHIAKGIRPNLRWRIQRMIRGR